jgi:flagellar motility protein MotE (MotC chaperone)
MSGKLLLRSLIAGIAALLLLKAGALATSIAAPGFITAWRMPSGVGDQPLPHSPPRAIPVAATAEPRQAAPEPAQAFPRVVAQAVAQAAAPTAPQPDPAEAVAMQARRQALEERERALLAREAVITAAELRLSARIDELAALQQSLAEQDRGARERDEAQWLSLAKLYEGMRPREAAAVFNEMELSMLAQVVDRMRGQKASPVLGAMQPERVRALTAELARLRGARGSQDAALGGGALQQP